MVFLKLSSFVSASLILSSFRYRTESRSWIVLSFGETGADLWKHVFNLMIFLLCLLSLFFLLASTILASVVFSVHIAFSCYAGHLVFTTL